MFSWLDGRPLILIPTDYVRGDSSLGKFIFGDRSLGLDCSKRVFVGPSCDRFVRPTLAQWLKMPRAKSLAPIGYP